MRYGGWVAGLALLSAACGDAREPETVASATAVSGEDAALASDAPAPPAPAADAVSVKEETDLYSFAYAYPAQAAAIAPLKADLDKRMAKAKADLITESKEDQAGAKKDGYPYRAHSFAANWKVVTDLPDWLSLSADMDNYTGGAHGMYWSDTLLWDKRGQALRQPIDLFTGKDALRAAIRAPFCAELDKQRAKKREGFDMGDTGVSEFTQCIDPLEQVVILGSSNRQTFDRIGFLIAPYNAGPYAEGSYEVTLPVTAKVMAALKPQYRGSFSIGR